MLGVIRTLRALRFLFVGPIILGVLVVVNMMTTPGDWWVKWAALGIGIAWIFSLIRVIQTVILVGGVAALVAYLKKKDRLPGS